MQRWARLSRRRRYELFGLAQESVTSASSLIDVREPEQPLVYVNPAFERLTGYRPTDAIGRSWKLSEGSETDPQTAARLHEAVDRGVEIRVTMRHHRRDATAYWSEVLMAPITVENGSITHYMSIQKDVSVHAKAVELASHMAYHDVLTGLPNRAQLQEHLSLALARAQRKEAAFALVFLDLDLFKRVNDRYGHDVGDRLLADVASRWRAVARDGDVLARYGGDEFVLLITDVPRDCAPDTAVAASARYTDALTLPFERPGAAGQLIEISASAGIALYPDDANTPAALLLAADADMYARKRARHPNREPRAAL